MPMYVSPEQVMRDRAEYSRKGIARGRAVVGMRYADGILLVAHNHSQTLQKISEIYDRIGFAAVGRYNEFEALRIAGIRQAGEARRVDGEAFIRFFRQGYAAPAVIHLTKDDRVFTVVIHHFLQAATVYEKYVDFTFNEEESGAGL